MNATACERVTNFSLNYTPGKFNDLCAHRQNSKTINRMKKLKLSLNLDKNTLSIKKEDSTIAQIIREIDANECNSL